MEGTPKCILSTFKNKRDGNLFGISLNSTNQIRRPLMVEILDVDPVYGVKYDSSTWAFQEGASKFAYFNNRVSQVEHYRTPAPLIGNTQLVYSGKLMIVSWCPSDDTKGIFILRSCDHPRHSFVDTNRQRVTINCCENVLENIASTMLRPVCVKLLFKDKHHEKEMILEFMPGCARNPSDPPPGKGEFKAKLNACWYCKVDESSLEPFTFEGFLQYEGGGLHRNPADNTSISIVWMQEREDNFWSEQAIKGIMADSSTFVRILCSDGKKVACHPSILERSSEVLGRLVTTADSDSHNSSFTKADEDCIAKFDVESSITQLLIDFLYTKNSTNLQSRTLHEIDQVLRLAHENQVDQLAGLAMTVIVEKGDAAWFEIKALIKLYAFVRLLPLNTELAVKLKNKMLTITRKSLLTSKNKRVRPNEGGDKEETVLLSLMQDEDYQQILIEYLSDLSTHCLSNEE